jgi:glycosyltransferase involved in cell wall biosynthesis
MRALVLPRYDYDGASSRYRSLQFAPHLHAAGIDCDISPFFSAGYVKRRFEQNRTLALRSFADYLRRWRVLIAARRYDVMLVEKEFFPYWPAMLELQLVPKSIPYVVDYDDAVFHAYDNHSSKIIRWLNGQKIGKVMARAASVVVGSEYLYTYAIRHNRHVDLIPTVIDLQKYPVRQAAESLHGPFLIGWIGSQSTAIYLKMIEEPLDRFCKTYNARLQVIGARPLGLNIESHDWIEWSTDTEIDYLDRIDVGIMPLPDTPWTRGKCAFKLIQYMGCWKPVIASPVGENARVVEEGGNGFQVSTAEEWFAALERLYQDRELARRMGRAGRAKAEAQYSLDKVAPKLERVLRSAALGVKSRCAA